MEVSVGSECWVAGIAHQNAGTVLLRHEQLHVSAGLPSALSNFSEPVGF